jgi:hypothetical protein
MDKFDLANFLIISEIPELVIVVTKAENKQMKNI